MFFDCVINKISTRQQRKDKMDYENAIEYTPTNEEICIELKKHGITVDEFLADFGNKQVTGKQLLDWLGY